MTSDERAAEIERLEQMLSASKAAGPGYAARIKEIEAKLKELVDGG